MLTGLYFILIYNIQERLSPPCELMLLETQYNFVKTFSKRTNN